MAYQIWLLYGELDSNLVIYPFHTIPTFSNPGAATISPTFSQQVSGIVNWGTLFDVCVTETGLSCKGAIRYPLKPSDLTHARYRCDKTAFTDILAFVGSTLLAQMALTPRSVGFGMGWLCADRG